MAIEGGTTSTTIKEDLKKARVKWPCIRLWVNPFVQSDGSFIPCCIDEEGQLKLGNLASTSIAELLNSEALQRIRALHLEGKGDHPHPDMPFLL